jgi:SAM-dependent methyltransferase
MSAHAQIPPRSVWAELRGAGPRAAGARVAEHVRWRARPALRITRWESARFDRSVDVDISGKVWPTDPSVTTVEAVAGDASKGHHSVGEQIRVIRWWLDELPARLDGFTLVDIGCGKGRPLFAAAQAQKGFTKLIGIEYVKELQEAAVANVARFKGPKDAEIVPLLGDARSFEFPLEPLAIHLANPFKEDVMTDVLANLVRSYEEQPRPIFLVYYQEWEDGNATRNVDLLGAAPIFEKHRTLRGRGVVKRHLLDRHRLDFFETPEAVAVRAATATA